MKLPSILLWPQRAVHTYFLAIEATTVPYTIRLKEIILLVRINFHIPTVGTDNPDMYLPPPTLPPRVHKYNLMKITPCPDLYLPPLQLSKCVYPRVRGNKNAGSGADQGWDDVARSIVLLHQRYRSRGGSEAPFRSTNPYMCLTYITYCYVGGVMLNLGAVPAIGPRFESP